MSAEKAPLCSFFAAGCCNRENCSYSHTYCGKNAAFCVEFAKGYCSLGSNVNPSLNLSFHFKSNKKRFYKKCDKSHLTECPEFSKTKKCPRGKLCPLKHYVKETALIKTNDKSIVKESPENSIEDKMDFNASFISFKPTDNNNSTEKSQVSGLFFKFFKIFMINEIF